MQRNYRSRIAFLTIVYLILLVWVISFKCNRPFPVTECLRVFSPMSIAERISAGIRFSFKDIFTGDGLQNVVIFIPLGILLPLLFERDGFFRYLFLAVLLTGILEAIQLFTCVGQWALLDLVSNTLGYVIGYILYRLLVRQIPRRAVGVIVLFAIFVMTPIAVYAIYRTVVNFDLYLQ